FGPQTTGAVRLFQARFPDVDGQPLRIDGLIGAITWAALFGDRAVTAKRSAAGDLLRSAMEVASSQVGVLEKPPGSNRGPEVDVYLTTGGLDPKAAGKDGFAWCAAVVYVCFERAAKKLGRSNPVVKTAGVLDHWDRAVSKGIANIPAGKAHANEALVSPGHIFIVDTGAPGGAG